MTAPPDGEGVVPLIDKTAKWYRLAACCPVCRRRPKVRLRAAMIELANTREPDDVLLSYECHGRDCTARYEIAAVAYQLAEPEPRAA
jgi:hypothetical protein